jgi:hypothetical protein
MGRKLGKQAKTPLVYILAASHSGSTLLAMLLGSHPEICTVGELKFTSLGDPDIYRCSCRVEIGQCPFWRGIGEEMASRGYSFDVRDAETDYGRKAGPYAQRLLRPLHRGPLLEWLRDRALLLSSSWRAGFQDIQKKNTALAASICARTGKKVLVDSSKIGIRLKFLMRNSGLDVRIIRLVRDGRGVALTYTDPANFADARDPNLRGGGSGRDREGERLPIALAAREWLRSNQEEETILRGMDPRRWTLVRYEELCTDTDSVLARLFRFLDVDPSRMAGNFRSVEQHVVGNGMRLDSTSDIRLDERWKSVFSAKDIATFESVAGAMNKKLGYR